MKLTTNLYTDRQRDLSHKWTIYNHMHYNRQIYILRIIDLFVPVDNQLQPCQQVCTAGSRSYRGLKFHLTANKGTISFLFLLNQPFRFL